MEELDKPNVGSKACARCGVIKPLSEFYRKGSKLDYACKECKRGARRQGYKKRSEQDVIETLKRITGFIAQHELAEISKFNGQFEEFLSRCGEKEGDST